MSDALKRRKTLFIDIDGTLFKHHGNLASQVAEQPCLLPGVLMKFDEWDRKGYNIILVSGRRESMREATARQLSSAGIFYDQLIMGIGGGERVMINDSKPDGDRQTASAVVVTRNEGLGGINV